MNYILSLIDFYKTNLTLKYYLFIEFYNLEINSINYYDWVNKIRPPQHEEYTTMRMCYGDDERDFTWMNPERNFITWSCYIIHKIFHKIFSFLFPLTTIIHEYIILFIELFNIRIAPLIYLILILSYTLKFESTLLIFFFSIFVYLLYLNIFNLIDNELNQLILTNYLNFKQQIIIKKNKLKSLSYIYSLRFTLKQNIKKLIKTFLKYLILILDLNINFLNIKVVFFIYCNILFLIKKVDDF